MSNANTKVLSGSESFEYEGKSYQFAKLTLADLGSFESYAQSEPLEKVTHLLERMSPEVRQDVVATCFKQGEGRKIGTKEFNGFVTSMTGILFFMYLSMRTHHPEISRKEVATMFGNLMESGRSDEIKTKLFKAGGFEVEGPNAGGGRTVTKSKNSMSR